MIRSALLTDSMWKKWILLAALQILKDDSVPELTPDDLLDITNSNNNDTQFEDNILNDLITKSNNALIKNIDVAEFKKDEISINKINLEQYKKRSREMEDDNYNCKSKSFKGDAYNPNSEIVAMNCKKLTDSSTSTLDLYSKHDIESQTCIQNENKESQSYIKTDNKNTQTVIKTFREKRTQTFNWRLTPIDLPKTRYGRNINEISSVLQDPSFKDSFHGRPIIMGDAEIITATIPLEQINADLFSICHVDPRL